MQHVLNIVSQMKPVAFILFPEEIIYQQHDLIFIIFVLLHEKDALPEAKKEMEGKMRN